MACSSVKVLTLRTGEAGAGQYHTQGGVKEERGTVGLTGEGCFVLDINVLVLAVPLNGFL
jgi:hypothetical protein